MICILILVLFIEILNKKSLMFYSIINFINLVGLKYVKNYNSKNIKYDLNFH